MAKRERSFPHLRLSKPITVSIFNSPEKRFIELSAGDLGILRESGLISLEAYVFFAIGASFRHKNPSIHVHSFCEMWELQREDFLRSAAALKAKFGAEFELVPEPQEWDVVLGGDVPQPQPGDAVLGGQDE